MPIRFGIDVGGTFTKAVACNDATGELVGVATVPTTHEATHGVSEGVVAAAAEVSSSLNGHGSPVVIAHSTTQAVNALLEGDTATVGIVGLGRRPDVRRALKRTKVGNIAIAPGRELRTLHSFIDCSDGLDEGHVHEAVDNLRERGATAVCVSQAFGVEDPREEELVARIARSMGLATCAGHELTGLYGLEMRTVTAAVNASILPAALSTASFVEEAFTNGRSMPLLVMRGDGGAADLASMRRHPLLTAFSGPAASVAGALRTVSLQDGIVIEVGGTSSNISPVRGGRPILSYIRVLDHVTCVRSLDVRVAGVGGGSLIRVATKRGRLRLADVGPRSAHIAGLEYCSFAEADLSHASVRSIAPRPGDPPEYVVLETPDGRRFAPTPTCAANALGIVPSGAYAYGGAGRARQAFAVIGRALGVTWAAAAERVLSLAAKRLKTLVSETCDEFELDDPLVLGVGGGAGVLVPRVAEAAGYPWSIPQHAEVISSIGDALSLVRTEIERTLPRDPSPQLIAELHRSAKEEAITAGASPDSVHVSSEVVPARHAIRAVATGNVALRAGSLPGDPAASIEELLLAAKAELGGDATLLGRLGFHSMFTSGVNADRWTVLDVRAVPVATSSGEVISGRGAALYTELVDLVRYRTRHIGPISVAPHVRLVVGSSFVDLGGYSSSEKVLEAAGSLLADEESTAFALLSRH